ncbi:MAG TPA: biotin/lipoate A/B protein ligase family protein [Candidatus Tectomicrobia bacterium]
MQQPWRFVDTGAHDAASNMALDEALLVMHEAGTAPPTLRVYGWCQPALSLGYAQNVQQEVDLAACHAQGVAVIRRPTGGRAVLHDQEVTYSVVMPIALADGPHTITEHYRRIGMALAAALQSLGLPVQLARPQIRAVPTRPPASPACFAALSRYELSSAGKKMVGSAQKRAQRALLQHGSIPLWLDRQRLFQCLQVLPEQRAALVQAAYTTMGAVNEVAAQPVAPAALHAALRQGFGVAFGVELVERPIAPEEWCLAQHLRTTKYATDAWNLDGAATWRQRQRRMLNL